MAESAGPIEVLFEFHRVGNSLRVAAIDPVSNIEVTIVAPAQCGEREAQRVALQKLAYVRGKRARAERGGREPERCQRHARVQVSPGHSPAGDGNFS